MDDVLSKVKEILDDPKKLEGFKNLASSLLSNDEKQENIQLPTNNTLDLKKMPDVESILKNFLSNNNGENKENKNDYQKDQLNFNVNMDMIFKIKNAMEIMNKDDKNIEFLRALRSLLANEKQQKVDNAIKVMRLIKLWPLLKEFNILKNFNLL